MSLLKGMSQKWDMPAGARFLWSLHLKGKQSPLPLSHPKEKETPADISEKKKKQQHTLRVRDGHPTANALCAE